jgi:hypothetical protein
VPADQVSEAKGPDGGIAGQATGANLICERRTRLLQLLSRRKNVAQTDSHYLRRCLCRRRRVRVGAHGQSGRQAAGPVRRQSGHNFVHLATGIVAIIAGVSGEKASRIFFQIFGVIYGLVAVLGFYYGDQPLLGIVANNGADSVLHVVIAVVALYLGFGMKPAATATT